LEGLIDARQRTLAAESARVELLIDHTWEMPPMPRRRRGGLLRPVVRVAKAAGKRLLKAVAGAIDLRHLSAGGVLDFAQRRYMVDYGSYARLYADGKEWDGRSGRRIVTLPPQEQELPTPLWLFDVLAGVTSATDEGTEDVRGTPCRHIAATTDMSRASRTNPGGVAVPTRRRFEDLLALPVEVWFDSTHVRRVRFVSENRTETLELWDFGVRLDDLDWTRLPSFRSTDEATR
jgi:hypothetical protein